MPLVKVSSPEVEQLKEVPPFLMKKLMKARRAHRVHVAATLMGQMDATYAPSTLKATLLAEAVNAEGTDVPGLPGLPEGTPTSALALERVFITGTGAGSLLGSIHSDGTDVSELISVTESTPLSEASANITSTGTRPLPGTPLGGDFKALREMVEQQAREIVQLT